MYPETDVPRVPITKEMLLGVEKTVKELASAQEEKEEALSSLPPELASQLSAAKGLLAPSEKQKPGATPEISAFFLSQGAGIDAKLAASALTNTLASIRREGAQTQALTPERFVSALLSVKQGVIAKAALPEVLKALCSDPSATPQSAAKQLCLEKITGAALQKLIADEKPDFAALMAKYRLRVDAQEAKGLFGKKG
jgi:Glu-tRNA(Gln) amidotransferase subunit E-like FAD-binding protein